MLMIKMMMTMISSKQVALANDDQDDGNDEHQANSNRQPGLRLAGHSRIFTVLDLAWLLYLAWS
jgi:hypothetical protein